MDITMSGGTGHLSINYKHKYTIQKKLDLQLLTKMRIVYVATSQTVSNINTKQ